MVSVAGAFNMIKKQWLINMALALLTLIVSVKAYDIWQEGDQWAGIEADPSERASRSDTVFNPVKRLPEKHFNIVTEQNLFSPDRREVRKSVSLPSPLKDQQAKTPEPVATVKPIEKVEGKKISLFGVMLLPGYKAAIVTNPEEDDNQHVQKKVKVGESLGDYKIVDIQVDRILLSKNRERFEIPLYDKDTPKARRKDEKKDPVKKIIAPKVIDTTPEVAESGKGASANQKDDDAWEVVDTPFGKIKRRKK